MTSAYWLIFGCGILAILYGVYASRTVLTADPGSERMREIAGAIQEGANAYLNRQYRAISVVGVIIGVFLWWQMGQHVALGYTLGAVLSVASCYVGMYVSVRAYVRTAEAARKGIKVALEISF